ncbi:phosphopyruvate hydratase [Sporomusa termitida]|uniref:Enolase n=1 Tax=Sporomusa termitida TaxID=2377 RepID=A0A517DYP1_9FIRM|nr:phosphopyruvate hydratase [Sporomusa termitida]QDR82475.1 Enolase [Sporomusa termitida]
MRDTRIKRIKARQVFDSRANPTVEVDVELECGSRGRGTVPSGASTGIYEALELRDGNPNSFRGKSVLKAVENVNQCIAPALTGTNALKQSIIDMTMLNLDGTENKSKLGANAILGVSIATAWAAANACETPLYRYLGGVQAVTLPVPMVQIIGGGLHAGQSIDIQDFLIIPVGAATYSHGIEMVANVYHATKEVFTKYGKPLSVADEGGFWPTFSANAEGLDLLVEGIRQAGYQAGAEVAIALDIAASHFYQDGKYTFAAEGREMDSQEFARLLSGWVDKYPIISIEDGMAEDDWDGWSILSAQLKNRIQLIGDDLFTTNAGRIKRGIDQNIANSVLIKMNQIGTITETLQAVELTRNAGYLPVVSARSGETEDATIVHLAIATNAGQLKVGSIARTERTVKWNELLRIEEELGTEAVYPGQDIFRRIIKE